MQTRKTMLYDCVNWRSLGTLCYMTRLSLTIYIFIFYICILQPKKIIIIFFFIFFF